MWMIEPRYLAVLSHQQEVSVATLALELAEAGEQGPGHSDFLLLLGVFRYLKCSCGSPITRSPPLPTPIDFFFFGGMIPFSEKKHFNGL